MFQDDFQLVHGSTKSFWAIPREVDADFGLRSVEERYFFGAGLAAGAAGFD
jgi:hypothetical protein